jgi:hypothetical protein
MIETLREALTGAFAAWYSEWYKTREPTTSK